MMNIYYYSSSLLKISVIIRTDHNFKFVLNCSGKKNNNDFKETYAVLVFNQNGIRGFGEIKFDLNRATFTTVQKQDH